MNSTRILSALALGAALGLVPVSAQTPFFLDGTATGGSKVFSEGMNPLGNCARFDQPQQPATYFTYLDGDQRAQDNKTAMDDLGVGGSHVTATADQLNKL